MGLASISHTWPYLAVVGLLVALGVYAWRRDVPGARPFAIACLLMVPALVGAAAETAAKDIPSQIAWYKFQGVWELSAATAMTSFVLEYVHPGRWLVRRNLILLYLPPLLFLALSLTNDLHHLFYLDFVVSGSLRPLLGIAGWIALAYGQSLILVNIALFVALFIRSPQHRWPVALMVVGQIASRVLYTLELAALYPPARLDLLLLAVAIPFGTYAIALFGFRIFDPIPLARRMAIEQSHAGMLVLDPRGGIVSLNPAAEKILDVPASRARGRSIKELLPVYPDGPLAVSDGSEMEFSLGEGQEVRHYAMAVSLLRDWRGLDVGRLLLLRDVTESKQAQAALKESEEKLRTIFENAFDGIAVYEEHPDTQKRRLLDCNERYAQMSGRSRKELLEIGDPALVQQPLAPVPYAKPRTEIEAAQSVGFFSWVRPDSKENIIEYSAVSIRVGGRLLTIGLDRDVTERKQAEAQLLRQQQALAMLHERERLARELHDGLGQVFAFINAQGQAIHRLLARGDVATADDYVGRLVEVAHDADADIRESILGLRVSLSQEGFFPVLVYYLARYEKNYGIHTRLEKPQALEDGAFEPLVEVELLRILQEALTNVRKHAGAHSVHIAFAVEDSRVCVTIQDDGQGFDLRERSDESDGHVGLRVMRERAAEVGGSLSLHSAPGRGTVVTVQVPLKSDMAKGAEHA